MNIKCHYTEHGGLNNHLSIFRGGLHLTLTLKLIDDQFIGKVYSNYVVRHIVVMMSCHRKVVCS